MFRLKIGKLLKIYKIIFNRFMSDSDSESDKQKKSHKEKNKKELEKQKIAAQKAVKSRHPPEDDVNVYDQNKKLRRKLKQLSMRLDEQLQKAAEYKLKHINQRNGHPVSLQSQNLQLQNAYKMIERLQKAVKDFESKQSYQITLKRVLDLESIIKKKQSQSEVMKTQIKTQKKIIKEKQKYIEELIQNSKKMSNPAQDLQTINKLKTKMKKIMEENDLLRRKELQKHERLVVAERRIIDLQQDHHQDPIGRQQSLLKQVQQMKAKYKQTIQRIQRQNIYISKLNQKLNRKSKSKSKRDQKRSENNSQRKVSRSMQELPDLKQKVNTSNLLEHLPFPQIPVRLKRY